jgi:hypothetical protein
MPVVLAAKMRQSPARESDATLSIQGAGIIESAVKIAIRRGADLI